MLRSLDWEQFREWQVFSELEPFGEERDDIRSASIVQALWNIARDTKQCPNGWPLEDFLLAFGDAPKRQVKQSVETIELHIDAWVAGQNAIVEAQKGK